MRILVTDGMDKSAIETLCSDGHEIVEQFYAPDALGEALRSFDAVVIRSATKIRVPQIDATKGSQLKLIIRAGVGVDNIDVEYAEQNGISVRNTPRASSDSVAELAIALMFSCARFISAAGFTMHNGKWEKKAYSDGTEINGKTLGIIGYGRIGRALASRAVALGMKVVAHDIYLPAEPEKEPVQFVSFEALLSQSDYISLHTPSIDGKVLINADTIAKMKDGVIFINTSRGNNVDEAALLAALESGKVHAAGLDVFAEEPTPNSALYSHPMVSSTPHIGAATQEAQNRIGAEIVEIIRSFA